MSLFSPYWYRAEHLRPRLKRHAQCARHVARGRVWHVVANRATGEFFRLTSPAYALVGLMDGERTVSRIWREAGELLGDDLPSQDEFIQLLSRLYQIDILATGAAPDVSDLSERRRERLRKKRLQQFKNPFAIRIPLIDPNAFLDRWTPAVAPLFSPWGGLALFLLIAYAAVQTGLHWPELSAGVFDRVTTFQNVALMIMVYPIIKAFHELGHAFAVKRGGGEAHEIGVMLLFFMPVPYVDASAATIWPSKWRRALVAAMGVLVELAIASLALLVWINVESGWVSAVAFAVMLTAGVSTLLFNGNPLLRFDGYYVLSDLIEIPNLASRSNAYIGRLIKTRIFGAESPPPSTLAPGEPAWLVCYGVAAFLYRIFITAAILLLVSGWFFELGLLLAGWVLVNMAALPLYNAIRALYKEQGLMAHKSRTTSILLGALAGLVILLFLLPLPYGAVESGVALDDEAALVTAGAPGFVRREARPGAAARQGDLILVIENHELEAQRTAFAAELAALEATLDAERARSPSAAAKAREQLTRARAALAYTDEQIRSLSIAAPSSGAFEPLHRASLLGRHVEKGEVIGRIVDPGRPVRLRVAAPEAMADLIRGRRPGVRIRFRHRPGEVYAGRVIGETPAVGNELPSPALSTLGAGGFALDPAQADRLASIEPIVIFEIETEDGPPNDRPGAVADVRFDFGWAPLGAQIGRPLRQMLLKALRI